MKQTQQIDLVFEGFGSTGNIYISNYSAAYNYQTIKTIITTAKGLLLPHNKSQLPNYLYLPIEDNLNQQIVKYFTTTYDFIEKNRNRTNVLVHCFSGISRSAAFIIAYLSRRYGYSVIQCLLLLRRRRPKINPNKSFIKQLQTYQIQIQSQHHNANRSNGNNVDDKKIKLVTELNNIKELRKSIEVKIGEAKQKLQDSQKRKRSSSQYLKQRIQEKKAQSCKINSHRHKKIDFDLQFVKGLPSSFRSNNS